MTRTILTVIIFLAVVAGFFMGAFCVVSKENGELKMALNEGGEIPHEEGQRPRVGFNTPWEENGQQEPAWSEPL